jgi:hypothetical protein
MKGSRDDLQRRRQELLVRSSLLREEWSRQVQVLRAPLHVADQARAGVSWLAAHPEWPLGVAALLLVLRPSRALRWAGFAWQGYALYRRAQRMLARMPAR